jgi:hypothetical protein
MKQTCDVWISQKPVLGAPLFLLQFPRYELTLSKAELELEYMEVGFVFA